MKRKPTIADFTKDSPLRLMDTRIQSDIFGSYTGIPEEGDEIPVQDADDL